MDNSNNQNLTRYIHTVLAKLSASGGGGGDEPSSAKIEFVDTLPTASEDTVGIFYVIPNPDGNTGTIHITQNDGSTYSWVTVRDPETANVQYTQQTLTEAQKQQARNNIDAASLADIENLDYVTAATLPTASAETMGHVYLIGPDASNNYQRYYTQQNGSSYSWVDLGSTQLDLSTYATEAEVIQLEAKVNGYENVVSGTYAVTSGEVNRIKIPFVVGANKEFTVRVDDTDGILNGTFAIQSYDSNGSYKENIEDSARENVDYTFTLDYGITFIRISLSDQIITASGNVKITLRQHISDGLIQDVSSLKNRMTTAEGNITNIQGDIATLQTAVGMNTAAREKAEKVTRYVSTTGSDTNDGTAGSPFATIQKAVTVGAERIMIYGGIYNEQDIDLASFKGAKLHIERCEDNKNVDIVATPVTISNNDGNVVVGYTNVRKLEGVTVDSSVYLLYLVGVNYGLIPDDERMPQQKGREYRMDDTIIRKCYVGSRSASDILSEMETAAGNGVYMFYSDGTDLYFTRPSAVSADNPLVAAPKNGNAPIRLFANTPAHIAIEMVCINVKWMQINIWNTIGSRLIDCKQGQCYGSGINFTSSIDTLVLRCEGYGNGGNKTGDGIGGSSSTGEADSKGNTTTISNCWFHDMLDDGYSDHAKSECLIEDSLFEYNGKAGVTPSYGTHCSCHNVVSRHNTHGFFCGGAPTDNGETTDLLLFNCVSYKNDNPYGASYYNGNSEHLAGLVSIGENGATGRSILQAYNCIIVGEDYPAWAEVNGYIWLNDCSGADNSHNYYPSSGNLVTVKNTTTFS